MHGESAASSWTSHTLAALIRSLVGQPRRAPQGPAEVRLLDSPSSEDSTDEPVGHLSSRSGSTKHSGNRASEQEPAKTQTKGLDGKEFRVTEK